MIRRRMVVGKSLLPDEQPGERPLPRRWREQCLDGLTQPRRFPRPSFNKGAKPLREDFARAGNGSTAKLAHMQDQLHLATSARHICHQAGKVNSGRGWPPEYTADRGGFSLSPSYGG